MPTKRGTTQLGMTATTSYVTAEADVETLDINASGWAVVEAKFQELRALLSAPTTGLNASQAREEQKRAVSAAITRLLDRAQAECRRLLIAGNAKAAVEGGLKTLKLKEEYYGAGSLQLVPAYFHLARTNQFMDKFKRAEEFLSLAQYEVLRHPEADISLHAELHQTFGLLYASDGKLDAALKQLTCSTYYLASMHGPEHVLTAFGYFDIGNVFAAKSHMEHAMAFYDRVKKIWETYLTASLEALAEGDEAAETPATFGEENVQDAAKMLRGIVGLQTERYGQVHPSPAHGEHVLGMFLLWSGDGAGGFETLLRALEIYKRVVGERHPKCQAIRLLLVNHGFQVPEDTAGVLSDDSAANATTTGAEAPASAPPTSNAPAAPQEQPVAEEQPPAAAEAPAAPQEAAAESQPQPAPQETGDGAAGGAEAAAEPPVAPSADAPTEAGGGAVAEAAPEEAAAAGAPADETQAGAATGAAPSDSTPAAEPAADTANATADQTGPSPAEEGEAAPPEAAEAGEAAAAEAEASAKPEEAQKGTNAAAEEPAGAADTSEAAPV